MRHGTGSRLIDDYGWRCAPPRRSPTSDIVVWSGLLAASELGSLTHSASEYFSSLCPVTVTQLRCIGTVSGYCSKPHCERECTLTATVVHINNTCLRLWVFAKWKSYRPPTHHKQMHPSTAFMVRMSRRSWIEWGMRIELQKLPSDEILPRQENPNTENYHEALDRLE